MNYRAGIGLGLLTILVVSGVTAATTVAADPGTPDGVGADRHPDRPYDSWRADRLNASSPSDAGPNATSGSEPDARSTRLVAADGSVQFQAASDQVLRGETDLAPGSDLLVVIVSQDPGKYIGIQSVTVGPDGTFRTRFDMSDLDSGTTLRVLVSHDGTEVVNETADVVAAHDGADVEDRWGRIYVGSGHETISGNSSMPAGTRLTVVVHAAGDADFERKEVVRVDARGRFQATFDLESLSHGTTFQVRVLHDGYCVDHVTGLVLN